MKAVLVVGFIAFSGHSETRFSPESVKTELSESRSVKPNRAFFFGAAFGKVSSGIQHALIVAEHYEISLWQYHSIIRSRLKILDNERRFVSKQQIRFLILYHHDFSDAFDVATRRG